MKQIQVKFQEKSFIFYHLRNVHKPQYAKNRIDHDDFAFEFVAVANQGKNKYHFMHSNHCTLIFLFLKWYNINHFLGALPGCVLSLGTWNVIKQPLCHVIRILYNIITYFIYQYIYWNCKHTQSWRSNHWEFSQTFPI